MEHLIAKGLSGDHQFPYKIMFMCGRPVIAREVSKEWPFDDHGSKYQKGGIKAPICGDCGQEAKLKITEISEVALPQTKNWWWCGGCSIGG